METEELDNILQHCVARQNNLTRPDQTVSPLWDVYNTIMRIAAEVKRIEREYGSRS